MAISMGTRNKCSRQERPKHGWLFAHCRGTRVITQTPACQTAGLHEPAVWPRRLDALRNVNVVLAAPREQVRREIGSRLANARRARRARRQRLGVEFGRNRF